MGKQRDTNSVLQNTLLIQIVQFKELNCGVFQLAVFNHNTINDNFADKTLMPFDKIGLGALFY